MYARKNNESVMYSYVGRSQTHPLVETYCPRVYVYLMNDYYVKYVGSRKLMVYFMTHCRCCYTEVFVKRWFVVIVKWPLYCNDLINEVIESLM